MSELLRVDVTSTHVSRGVCVSLAARAYARLLEAVQDTAGDHGYVFVVGAHHAELPQAVVTAIDLALTQRVRGAANSAEAEQQGRALTIHLLNAIAEQEIGLVADPELMAARTLERARRASTPAARPHFVQVRAALRRLPSIAGIRLDGVAFPVGLITLVGAGCFVGTVALHAGDRLAADLWPATVAAGPLPQAGLGADRQPPQAVPPRRQPPHLMRRRPTEFQTPTLESSQ